MWINPADKNRLIGSSLREVMQDVAGNKTDNDRIKAEKIAEAKIQSITAFNRDRQSAIDERTYVIKTRLHRYSGAESFADRWNPLKFFHEGSTKEIARWKERELRNAQRTADRIYAETKQKSLKNSARLMTRIADIQFLAAIDSEIEQNGKTGKCYHGVKKGYTIAGIEKGEKLDGGSANDAPMHLNENQDVAPIGLGENPDAVRGVDINNNSVTVGTTVVFKDAFSSKLQQYGHICVIVANKVITDANGHQQRIIIEASDHVGEYQLSKPGNIDRVTTTDKNGNKVLDPKKIAAYIPIADEADTPERRAAEKKLIQNIPVYMDRLMNKLQHEGDSHKRLVLQVEIEKLQELEQQHISDIYRDLPKGAANAQNVPNKIMETIQQLSVGTHNDIYTQKLNERLITLKGIEKQYFEVAYNRQNPQFRNIPNQINSLIDLYRKAKNDDVKDMIQDRIVNVLQPIELLDANSIYVLPEQGSNKHSRRRHIVQITPQAAAATSINAEIAKLQKALVATINNKDLADDDKEQIKAILANRIGQLLNIIAKINPQPQNNVPSATPVTINHHSIQKDTSGAASYNNTSRQWWRFW